MPQENEIKLALQDLRRTRQSLRTLGFRIQHARVFELNIALDDERGSLRTRGLLLRVRTAGKKVTCTYKGPETAGVHKSREEREFHADDASACLAVFEGLGFTPTFSYEKYRTEFARDGEPGIVTVDETPIGNFMELEGPARWLDRTAKELGYSRTDYITTSYGRLYEQWCEEYDADPTAMRFD